MVTINSSDFNIKTIKQKEDLRKKMTELAETFVSFAKKSCPEIEWDYYITRKMGYKEEWGAIFPIKIGGNEDMVMLSPNIFFNIPQENNKMILALDVEFEEPRNLLVSKCVSCSAVKFAKIINLAEGAEMSLIAKEVFGDDNWVYHWTKIQWDDVNFPDKEASLCSEQDLRCLQNLLRSPSKHIHYDIYWSYEPMFLIKYEIETCQVISNSAIEKLFEDKIKVLAKIAEYLIK